MRIAGAQEVLINCEPADLQFAVIPIALVGVCDPNFSLEQSIIRLCVSRRGLNAVLFFFLPTVIVRFESAFASLAAAASSAAGRIEFLTGGILLMLLIGGKVWIVNVDQTRGLVALHGARFAPADYCHLLVGEIDPIGHRRGQTNGPSAQRQPLAGGQFEERNIVGLPVDTVIGMNVNAAHMIKVGPFVVQPNGGYFEKNLLGAEHVEARLLNTMRGGEDEFVANQRAATDELLVPVERVQFVDCHRPGPELFVLNLVAANDVQQIRRRF